MVKLRFPCCMITVKMAFKHISATDARLKDACYSCCLEAQRWLQDAFDDLATVLPENKRNELAKKFAQRSDKARPVPSRRYRGEVKNSPVVGMTSSSRGSGRVFHIMPSQAGPLVHGFLVFFSFFRFVRSGYID